MRLVAAALALALGAAAAAPAPAQVPLAPLAPGEQLLQISGLGRDTTMADRALLTMLIGAWDDNPTAARRKAADRLARAIAAARTAGVPVADIEAGPVTEGLVSLPMPMRFQILEGPDRARPANAGATLRVTVRNLARLAAVRAALEATGTLPDAPTYLLNDEGAALRRARAHGLQRARADAETQAAGLNMRVVRIARISERLGDDGLDVMLSEYSVFNRLFGMMLRSTIFGPEVETMVTVGVDFVLAPR